jgi:hypothetical protein
LASYARGRAILNINPAAPPSYRLTAAERDLADLLSDALDGLAEIAASADPKALTDLTEEPRPKGAIRRIPQI